MPDLGRAGRQLKSWIWRAAVEEEVSRELEFHVEMRVREYRDRGLDPVAARRAALARLGDRERVAAECRRIGRRRDFRRRRLEYLAELRQDVKYAIRQIRRSPLTSGVAMATLALGIGATTAIFSAVRAVVLGPFPFEHADRVVLVSETLRGNRGDVAPGNYVDWRELSSSFSALAAFTFRSFNLADEGQPERVLGAQVSPAFFAVLGVFPARGRAFSEADEVPGRDALVLLSDELWRRRYASDPNLIGEAIHLNGRPHTVVGIMPAGFDPTLSGEDLWVPLPLGPDRRADYDAHYLNVIGRLEQGVSLQQAHEEMNELARQQAERIPEYHSERSARVESLPRVLVGDYRSRLLIILGAVLFILVIACANVANLLLASGAARAKELAVRAALGAGAKRVARQLLSETLVMAVLAGTVGVGLAFFGMRTLVAVAPAGIPRIQETRLDLSVLGFALSVSILASLLAGLVPALSAARRSIESTLRDGRLALVAGRRPGRARMRTGLVVAEVALAFTLVVGSGLLIRTVSHLSGQPLGFEPERLITARVTLPRVGYESAEDVAMTFRRIPELLGARPGVESAAVTSQAPLGPGGNGNGLLPEGRPEEQESFVFARLRLVTSNYFETLGIGLVRGRVFDETDVSGGNRVMVVSEALAREAFPGENAIGKRIACCEGPGDARWKTVIGVVADVHSRGPATDVRPEFYLPISQSPSEVWDWFDRSMTVVARANRAPEQLSSVLREVLREIDPALPLYRIRTMVEERRTSLAENRFQMLLLTLLGAIGLSLATVGVYGVVSYFVSLRTSEIGLRMALGATSRDVLALLTRQGLWPVAAGLAIGSVLALGATRTLTSLLFGVSATDPLTYGLVVLLFLGIASLAVLVPARRAIGIDPTRALEAR